MIRASLPASNDNRPPIKPSDREAMIEAILEEFDLLCLGVPSPHRLEHELIVRHVR